MADHTRSHTTSDLYRILRSPIKDMYKGFMKWNIPSEKISPKHKTIIEGGGRGGDTNFTTSIKEPDKSLHGKTNEAYIISDPTTPISGARSRHHRSVEEGILGNMSRAFSRSSSRRSKTPTPSMQSALSRNASRRSKTPASFSRNESRRSNSDSDELLVRQRNLSSKKEVVNDDDDDDDDNNVGSLSRNRSKLRSPKAATPIIYSQSTALKKPLPVLKKLECTLEELCHGCVKKIMITRRAILNGIIEEEEEMLKIEVKPGWKKGTKITFEGKGDEKPGYLPADITFLIDERRHPLFSRDGDDLEIGVEIPLVNALTGCSISVPLLGGEKMSLSFDNIIYPGFQKVIRGQGMPDPRQKGIRGDLRIQFLVDFPSDLSEEQRAEAATILQDCS